MKIRNLEDYLKNNIYRKILKDLIKWEIFRFGINQEEFVFDLGKGKIKKDNKDVVLMINNGLMCNHTLKNLLDFKSSGDEESDGYYLARFFVEAGIEIPREVFVGIFSKFHSTSED